MAAIAAFERVVGTVLAKDRTKEPRRVAVVSVVPVCDAVEAIVVRLSKIRPTKPTRLVTSRLLTGAMPRQPAEKPSSSDPVTFVFSRLSSRREKVT